MGSSDVTNQDPWDWLEKGYDSFNSENWNNAKICFENSIVIVKKNPTNWRIAPVAHIVTHRLLENLWSCLNNRKYPEGRRKIKFIGDFIYAQFGHIPDYDKLINIATQLETMEQSGSFKGERDILDEVKILRKRYE